MDTFVKYCSPEILICTYCIKFFLSSYFLTFGFFIFNQFIYLFILFIIIINNIAVPSDFPMTISPNISDDSIKRNTFISYNRAYSTELTLPIFPRVSVSF